MFHRILTLSPTRGEKAAPGGCTHEKGLSRILSQPIHNLFVPPSVSSKRFARNPPIVMNVSVVVSGLSRKLMIMIAVWQGDGGTGPPSVMVNMPIIVGGRALVIMHMSIACAFWGRCSSPHSMAVPSCYRSLCVVAVDVARVLEMPDKSQRVTVLLFQLGGLLCS